MADTKVPWWLFRIELAEHGSGDNVDIDDLPVPERQNRQTAAFDALQKLHASRTTRSAGVASWAVSDPEPLDSSAFAFTLHRNMTGDLGEWLESGSVRRIRGRQLTDVVVDWSGNYLAVRNERSATRSTKVVGEALTDLFDAGLELTGQDFWYHARVTHMHERGTFLQWWRQMSVLDEITIAFDGPNMAEFAEDEILAERLRAHLDSIRSPLEGGRTSATTAWPKFKEPVAEALDVGTTEGVLDVSATGTDRIERRRKSWSNRRIGRGEALMAERRFDRREFLSFWRGNRRRSPNDVEPQDS